jgi:hypothetical protein
VQGGSYALALDSDAPDFGGFSRNDPGTVHHTVREGEQDMLYLYLPCRTVQVLKKI